MLHKVKWNSYDACGLARVTAGRARIHPSESSGSADESTIGSLWQRLGIFFHQESSGAPATIVGVGTAPFRTCDSRRACVP